MKARKMLSVICALVLTAGAAGCGKKPEIDTGAHTGERYTAAYPIQTDKTLKLWGFSTHQDYNDPREQPLYKEWMKRTGVHLDITVIPSAQTNELFNLMIASNDLPDIIGNYWTRLTGGPDQYIAEGVIRPLNELYEKYSPNLRRYLDENPDVDRMVKSDGGNYYMYPFVRESDYLTTYMGPMVRADIMQRLGLSDPETIDEWETVLRAFKADGIEVPYNPGPYVTFISGAFDAWFDFYLRDGKVAFGPAEPNFKSFLKTMARWYKDGLMEKDLASIDSSILTAKVVSGKSAMAFGLGGQMGQWLGAGQADHPQFSLRALKYPVLVKGQTSQRGQKELKIGGWGAAVSQQCEDPELAARFLDYAYGEDGHLFSNFGIEGESYDTVNGEPTFTDEMYAYKNGDLGLSISRYILSIGVSPCRQDERMYRQRMQTEAQRRAIELWGQTNEEAYAIPPIIPLEEESARSSQLQTSINAYYNEMLYKFIFGQASLDHFDTYVAELNRLGLGELIALKQAAVDRYNNR